MKTTTIEPRRAQDKDRSTTTMALAASREVSRDGSMSKKPTNWNVASSSYRRMHSQGHRPTIQSIYFLAVLLLVTVISPCAAQLGTTVCACSPPEIEITFDFSVTCNDTDVGNNTGVLEAECSVSPFQGGVAIDETPVVVSTIDVVELDRFNGVLKSSSVFQEFLDGDKFTYVTTSANVSGVNTDTVPGGWQFSMIGSNAQQQPLLLMWIIKFTNDCESYPVLVDGNKIAWSVFTNLTVPDASICPAIYSKPPTYSPTYAPVGVGPTPYTTTPVPPTTSTYSPTLATPPDGTQPPDGCYWAGPAYPKGGKGKGKGTTSKGGSLKSKKSKKSKYSKKSSSAKGSSQGKGYVEDVFYEDADEDSSYHYENDYGDWYWCPPGYEHEATVAPSWPAKGKGSSSSTNGEGSVNHRPMYMHTAPQAQSTISYSGGGGSGSDGGGAADYYYNANNPAPPPPLSPTDAAGSIQSQNTGTAAGGEGINDYWAAPPPPNTGSDTTTTSTWTSTGDGDDSDYYSYTPGSSSSSHPDSPAYGGTTTTTAADGGSGYYPADPYGTASTRGIPPTTTTTNNTTSSGTPTAIFIAAVAGGSVLALVVGFVVRRKLIYGDEFEDDGKVVVQTQSGEDHTVSTIGGGGGGNGRSSGEQVGREQGIGVERATSSGRGGGGTGPPMQV